MFSRFSKARTPPPPPSGRLLGDSRQRQNGSFNQSRGRQSTSRQGGDDFWRHGYSGRKDADRSWDMNTDQSRQPSRPSDQDRRRESFAQDQSSNRQRDSSTRGGSVDQRQENSYSRQQSYQLRNANQGKLRDTYAPHQHSVNEPRINSHQDLHHPQNYSSQNSFNHRHVHSSSYGYSDPSDNFQRSGSHHLNQQDQFQRNDAISSRHSRKHQRSSVSKSPQPTRSHEEDETYKYWLDVAQKIKNRGSNDLQSQDSSLHSQPQPENKKCEASRQETQSVNDSLDDWFSGKSKKSQEVEGEKMDKADGEELSEYLKKMKLSTTKNEFPSDVNLVRLVELTKYTEASKEIVSELELSLHRFSKEDRETRAPCPLGVIQFFVEYGDLKLVNEYYKSEIATKTMMPYIHSADFPNSTDSIDEMIKTIDNLVSRRHSYPDRECSERERHKKMRDFLDSKNLHFYLLMNAEGRLPDVGKTLPEPLSFHPNDSNEVGTSKSAVQKSKVIEVINLSDEEEQEDEYQDDEEDESQADEEDEYEIDEGDDDEYNEDQDDEDDKEQDEEDEEPVSKRTRKEVSRQKQRFE